MTIKIVALLAMAFPCAVIAQAHGKDREALFAKYSVPVFKGAAVQVDISSPDARMYRTRLRAAANKGATFAGHYAVAAWGCGTFCSAFAIVDLETGKVSFFPSTIQHTANGVDPLVGDAIACRSNSRAIHVIGALNEQDNAADRWYVWTGRQFKLIRIAPARTEPEE